ncbi:MAG TPA: YqgE/AlgH family protein [Solimonas sp.]|nr:YqgE/AlgH family protein [Solimonas sp.]
MAQITSQLVRQLRLRTGATLSDCRTALEQTAGDLERAARLIQSLAAESETAEDDESTSFRNQFLIAMPSLEDENFSHTVSLLCEHNDEGAIALVINRPTELRLSDMMEQMKLEHEALNDEEIVYWGGPVQPERGFVIHRQPGGWESCMEVDEGLFITTSRDILRAIGKGSGPKEFVVVLGYAGWGAGQLETEIMHNAWLNCAVDRQILFGTPARDRWQAATRLLGIDPTQLGGEAGHA